METSHSVSTLLIMTVMCLAAFSTVTTAQLVENYYKAKCPNKNVNVEDVVTSAVNTAFSRNGASMAGVLRIHFHDCFVNGCDGSVLIDSPSEKDAVPNLTLHGFEVVDAAKTAIETVCPGVVSCADILAMASQLAVKQLSGNKITWKVPTGRKDGLVSAAANVDGKIPPPTASVALLKSTFAAVGLSTEQMVTLSGGHSVGVAHCDAFQTRLTTPLDATLDPTFAAQLQAQCPAGTTNANTVVNLDVTTPTRLDEMYFRNLQVKKGLLPSDQNLQTDASTQPIVAKNANLATFGPRFRSAMLAMGNIAGGTAGNVRLNCRKFN